MRVAAVDIGTNSVLLLVAERRDDEVFPVIEHAEITRLGQGVDASRRLAPEAIDRTLACLARYGAEIRASGASQVAAVGTSAMRDAQGGGEFVARARDALGVEPRVVSGEEEAALTYDGALSGLAVGVVGGERPSVFDIGGGSTEVIWPESGTMRRVSLDVGSVRLTERHVRTDPPTDEELAAARQDVRQGLAALSPPAGSGELVGVAGTVTTIAALAHGVSPYDGSRVHGSRVSRSDLHRVLARLAAVPLAERRALPGLEPARADVIVAGAVVVDEVLAWAGRTGFVASDRGVRWGLALRLAGLSSSTPH